MLATELLVELTGARWAGEIDVQGELPVPPVVAATARSAPTRSSGSRSRPSSSGAILERLGFEVEERRASSPCRPGARAT